MWLVVEKNWQHFGVVCNNATIKVNLQHVQTSLQESWKQNEGD